MPHSQTTALQQTVCKFHLDPQYHISHWGSTILGDSTLWNGKSNTTSKSIIDYLRFILLIIRNPVLISLLWRHNGLDCVSNHQPHECLLITVHSGTDQRKHQSSASLAFVWGIHRRPVNSPHKGTVTRKMFSFDDVIMWGSITGSLSWNQDPRINI